jgi:hypothetical protein
MFGTVGVPSKVVRRCKDDSDRWTVDSGQWTVDSG